MQDFDFSKVVYRCYPIRKPKTVREVEAIGFDSEADRDGNTFLYCLSDGSVYTPDSLLSGLFTREHRGKHYVVYNLKYEQGAILQSLPSEALNDLRECGRCEHNGHIYKTVGYKSLRISRGKNSVVFWDMYSFFNMSLASAARHFTDLTKIEQDVEQYSRKYIRSHWDNIVAYCRRDAEITERLFYVVVGMARRLGIEPTTFYSIASISYKYVRENTQYVTVKRLWRDNRRVLEAACNAYTGGKFEVTTRGKGTYYEYDINSAYPYEISRLVSIRSARVVEARTPPPYTVYGLLKCKVWSPGFNNHSVALKRRGVNVYPMGRFTKWMTWEEYQHLCSIPRAEVSVLRAYWLVVRRKRYPYRKLINRLYAVKLEAKQKDDKELYHFTKILLNAIYGKFVQLIRKGDVIEASTCWNPVYGAIITANTRLRLARLQNEYPEICAVHTDSVLSTRELPLPVSDRLGDWGFTAYGLGIILGSGIYQVGDKARFRGFSPGIDFFELLNKSPPVISFEDVRARSWREVVFHHWSPSAINRFDTVTKEFNINFDTKRLWSDKWRDGDDALNRVLTSLPLVRF